MARSGQQLIDVPMPWAGLDEQSGFARLKPNVTASALNVWPNDATTGRERISRRMGMKRAISSQFGVGSFQNISVAQVAVDEISGTGDAISVAGASGASKARVYGYAAGATDYTTGSNMVSSQTMGCTDEDNNFYVAAVAANQIQVLKVATTYVESWNVTIVGPSSANLVGIACVGGIVYVYVMPASGSAGALHGIYRLNASTGDKKESGPWLTSSGNNLVTVTGLSKAYQHICVTHGLLGVVGSDGTNLVLQQINLTTGVSARTTAIQSPLAHYPVKLVADAGGNFYVLTEAAGSAANKVYKIDEAGVIATNFPITFTGTIKDICYDPISYCIAVVGNAINGGTDSFQLWDATTGTKTAGGKPSEDVATPTATWAAVAADGIGTLVGSTTVGTFRLRQSSDATHYDLIRVVAPTAATPNPEPIWKLKTALTVTTDTLWVVASGLLVVPQESPMQSSRITRSVGVVAGSLYSFDLVANTKTLLSSTFASAAAPVVFSALALSPSTTLDQPTANIGRSYYFVDGTSYRTWNISTNQVGTFTATKGSLPQDPNGNKCTLIEFWRGRLLMAGLLSDPHEIFACRQDDVGDWNYTPSVYDPRQAWACSQEKCGRCPDRVMGIIPYTKDTFIALCNNSIHMMSGDPSAGGRWDMISDVTGGAWGRAWCKDPSGVIYFFGSRGAIWRMVPGQPPGRVSENIDTTRLFDLDLNDLIINMAWDERFRGIRVFISPRTDPTDTTTHFWWESKSDQYQMPNGSWWPFSFANANHNAVAVCVADGDNPSERTLLLGTRDGYLMTFDKDAKGDAGTAVNSYLKFGPIHNGGNRAVISDMQLYLSEDSGPANGSIFAGASIESAFLSTTAQVDDLEYTAGRSKSAGIRVGGHAQYIEIGYDALATPWAIEELKIVMEVNDDIPTWRRG